MIDLENAKDYLRRSAVEHAVALGITYRCLETKADLLNALEELCHASNVYADTCDVNVSLTGDKQVLNKAFHLLRTAGFEPMERPGEEAKPSFSTRFNHPDGSRIWLNFTSTVCKRVRIGVRTEEVPVYEVRCEDAADSTSTSTDSPAAKAAIFCVHGVSLQDWCPDCCVNMAAPCEDAFAKATATAAILDEQQHSEEHSDDIPF